MNAFDCSSLGSGVTCGVVDGMAQCVGACESSETVSCTAGQRPAVKCVDGQIDAALQHCNASGVLVHCDAKGAPAAEACDSAGGYCSLHSCIMP